MLAKSTKQLIMRNVDLLNYCMQHGINIDKLNKCNIEKMGDEFIFVLDKENVPVSKEIFPLDIDIATQPDIVLIVTVENNVFNVETTEFTKRILNL